MPDTQLDLRFISITREDGDMDVEVTFNVHSPLGETELVVPVRHTQNLNDAVEKAREMIREFGSDLVKAADKPFF